jgi:hypothetical protein
MAGNISKSKVVAVTVQKISNSNISVTNNGGQDASSLVSASVVTNPLGDSYTNTTYQTKTTIDDTHYNAILGGTVGNTLRITSDSNAFSSKTQVTVTGTFNDGTQQVLLDTTV